MFSALGEKLAYICRTSICNLQPGRCPPRPVWGIFVKNHSIALIDMAAPAPRQNV